MTSKKLGTLPGTWPFTCSVRTVDGELPGVKGVAALHGGRFARMRIWVEAKYVDTPELNEILHHEHKHAMDKSNILKLFISSRELEKRAYAYDDKLKGTPVPWMDEKDMKTRKIWRWVFIVAAGVGIFVTATVWEKI